VLGNLDGASDGTCDPHKLSPGSGRNKVLGLWTSNVVRAPGETTGLLGPFIHFVVAGVALT
jgi:hypothetical protein